MAETAPAKTFFLVEVKDEMDEFKLPSIGEVLGYFLLKHKNLKQKTLRDIAKMTLARIYPFYEKLGIPTRSESSAVEKVLKLFDSYRALKTNRTKKGLLHRNREAKFIEDSANLFDVADTNAIEIIRRSETKDFYEMQQRKGRPGTSNALLELRRKNPSPIPTPVPSPSSSTAPPNPSPVPSTSVSRNYGLDPDDTTPYRLRRRQTSNVAPTSPASDMRSLTESVSSISVTDTTKSSSSDFTLDEEKQKTPKPKKKEIIGERVVGALDKCRISGRCSVHVIVAVLEELKLNPMEYNVSLSTITNRRNAMRKAIYENAKDSFQVPRGAIVHFDGKIMTAITGKGTVDRLAVKVTYKGIDQLIGVPVTSDGTGLEVAAAVYQCLSDWKLLDSIDGCCFDTTSSNTGLENGAAIFLEHFLGRSLIHLPCRHHIFELILALVFEQKVCITTSGPRVKVFERFREQWGKIDPSKYESGINDPEINEHLRGIVKMTMMFIEEQMNKERQKKHLRADYYEFLELALLFIGGTLPKKPGQVIFHPPGACHHARWMSKALYSLKIYMFRSQFKLSAKERRGFGLVNVFLIRFYLKVWFQCPQSHCAARNDLQFIQDMVRYIKVDPQLTRLIIQKISMHLWYLSEEAVGMAFFDDKIPVQIKRRMVKNLCLGDEIQSSVGSVSEESDSEEDDLPEATVDYDDFEFHDTEEKLPDDDYEEDSDEADESFVSSRGDEEFEECAHKLAVSVDDIIKIFPGKIMSDFVTCKTFQFFQRFNIATDFLEIDPTLWATNKSYLEGLEVVTNIKVVNDTAERAIQLMSTFNQLVRDEKLTQFLLHVIEFYRKKFPSWHIKDLVGK